MKKHCIMQAVTDRVLRCAFDHGRNTFYSHHFAHLFGQR